MDQEVYKSKFKDDKTPECLNQVLSKKYANLKDTKIYHELGVLSGRSRVDMAVVDGILQ